MVHDGPRIIVADDDPAIRKLLDALLSREGYRVVLCADAEEAVAALDAGGDLLISDLEMPGRSGLDLIRALRNERNLVPILLMTGAEDHPSLPAALGCSGVQFLAKPFTVGECRKAVAGLVGRRTSRRS